MSASPPSFESLSALRKQLPLVTLKETGISKATAILARKAARAEFYNLLDWSGRKDLQCDTAQQPLF